MSEMEKRRTHRLAPCKRDVDYCGATLMQFDAFVISSISHVKEWVSGPLKKARLGRRVGCIVVDALEGRDAARRYVCMRR
jgi:hypothetical protein